jgi:hypothetical protein
MAQSPLSGSSEEKGFVFSSGQASVDPAHAQRQQQTIEEEAPLLPVARAVGGRCGDWSSRAAVIDYRCPDFIQQARDWNGGNFHYCIHLVGGHMSEACAELLVTHGSYADVTFLGTPASRSVLFDKGATFDNLSNYAAALEKETEALANYGRNSSRLTVLIETGKIAAPESSIVGSLCSETVKKPLQFWKETKAGAGK